jgi:hypothetical protein
VPLPLLRADWLEDRVESVYQQHPGYSEKASTLFTVDLGAPEDLPDALRGEKWSFVQLPLGTLQQVGAGAAAARCGCSGLLPGWLAHGWRCSSRTRRMALIIRRLAGSASAVRALQQRVLLPSNTSPIS